MIIAIIALYSSSDGRSGKLHVDLLPSLPDQIIQEMNRVLCLLA